MLDAATIERLAARLDEAERTSLRLRVVPVCL